MLSVNSGKRYANQKKAVVIILISDKDFISNNATGLKRHISKW